MLAHSMKFECIVKVGYGMFSSENNRKRNFLLQCHINKNIECVIIYVLLLFGIFYARFFCEILVFKFKINTCHPLRSFQWQFNDVIYFLFEDV